MHPVGEASPIDCETALSSATICLAESSDNPSGCCSLVGSVAPQCMGVIPFESLESRLRVLASSSGCPREYMPSCFVSTCLPFGSLCKFADLTVSGIHCCVLVAVFGEEVCTAAFNRMNRCGENQTSSTRCCDAVGSAALTCANRKADVLTDASLSAAAQVYLSDCVAEGEPECEVDRLIPRVFA
jgi:hypothetical protein